MGQPGGLKIPNSKHQIPNKSQKPNSMATARGAENSKFQAPNPKQITKNKSHHCIPGCLEFESWNLSGIWAVWNLGFAPSLPSLRLLTANRTRIMGQIANKISLSDSRS
jgi:hypothetical protein